MRLIFSLLFVVFIVTSVYSQQKLVTKLDSDQQRIVFLTFNSQFDEAQRLTDSYLKKNPNSLEWNYFNAMVRLKRLMHNSYLINSGLIDKTSFDKEAFIEESIKELEYVAKIGENLLEKNPKDTLTLFYTGAAYGYLGMYHASENSYLSAITKGKKGINLHDQLIEECPRWNDVYYSRGVFNYFASNVPWFIKPFMWIFGQSGTEYKAELYLKKTANWGNLAKYAAKEYLYQLYTRQEKYSEAISLIDELSTELPNNKYLYSLSIRYNDDTKEKAINLWKKLIVVSRKDELNEFTKRQVFHVYANVIQLLDDSFVNERIKLLEELLGRGLYPKYDSWCNLRLGDNHRLLGEKDKALKSYNFVVHNSPLEEQKKYALEMIKKLNTNTN